VKRTHAFLGLLAFLCQIHAARAVDLQERCTDDMLATSEAARGRNQWALSCNLITRIDFDCAINNGYYWTFNSLTGGANRAPTQIGLSCTGFKKFTMCPAGCFAASQRVLFEGENITPEAACSAGRQTITALAPQASLDRLSFQEQPIAAFIRGPEKGDLVRIVSAFGDSLEVTPNHPMVDGTGRVLPADQIHVGDVLLSAKGPQVVTGVQRLPFDGVVWNMRPVDATPKANIHVAEGFLTGSIRFQNEWANDATRLLLRQSLHPDAL